MDTTRNSSANWRCVLSVCACVHVCERERGSVCWRAWVGAGRWWCVRERGECGCVRERGESVVV